MKYQAYAEYKDSGVEWLDSVPIHWTSVPGFEAQRDKITELASIVMRFLSLSIKTAHLRLIKADNAVP